MKNNFQNYNHEKLKGARRRQDHQTLKNDQGQHHQLNNMLKDGTSFKDGIMDAKHVENATTIHTNIVFNAIKYMTDSIRNAHVMTQTQLLNQKKFQRNPKNLSLLNNE